MIKIIIFDFDGVIINEYTKHYELSKKQITNLSEIEFKRLFEGNIHAEREKLKKRDTGFDVKHYLNEHRKTVLIKPAVRKVLTLLSKNFTLGIISSAKESGMLECIKNSQLNGVFSFVYGFETHSLKDEKFKLMLNQFRISKQECIFVTDTLGDIAEANKVGIRTIAIDNGYHDHKTLLKGKPLAIISALSELLKIVTKM